ncbi:dentin matrix acidic phosphoprotein 1-like protein [Willisornis vidua]|uniref:Dentin matrix acidic phosphoprotein 1-like protein n=1 Tax=Willisornis vidua TaxID=1566151 RepID=A0ABQ9DK27_9PASS|nr:dentin matrix acidic phosphoprotein 1-like protein [Willisornis vidua]
MELLEQVQRKPPSCQGDWNISLWGQAGRAGNVQLGEEKGMSQVRGAPSRGISQAGGAPVETRPLGGGLDLRHGPGGTYRTSQGKRRLKAVMHVSRVAVSAHRPVGRAESARSRWKKAKIFPMILQKVKAGRKDSSYAKLMSAHQADGDKSMIIRGSYFQKSADDRPSMRKLNHVLKRISVSRKLQEPLGKDLARGEEESEREEAKSGVSISITAESEQEDSDYEKKKKRTRTSDESSEKSSSSGSESEDKDYLKITLDQDEATESTVDSDEETGQDFGDSDEDSESSSSSESEEDSSEEDDDEEDSDSDEGSSLSKSSSTESSFSRSGTSESSSRRSTEMSSIKSRGGSSGGRARHSSQKSSTGSSASGSGRDNSHRKTSGSSYKSKTSSASVEIEDTIEEVSEEDEEPDEMADHSSKVVSKTSARTAAAGEGKRGKAAGSGEDSGEEGAEEGDTDPSDREETNSKDESSCLESELSGVSKGPRGNKSTGKSLTSPDTDTQSSDTNVKRMKTPKKWAKKKRLKLIVDPEYETSSTGEDSAADCGQRNRLGNPGGQPNSNSNVYVAQNGSVVRTRRVCLGNNLKATSPVRLGKQFKKLDKLAVTHEESVPLSTLSKGPSPGDHMNTRPCSVSFAASALGAQTTGTKPGGSKLKSTEEQESAVDHEGVKEPLESHSEHTQSDEEELWMGPWNNLHIPMTKL